MALHQEAEYLVQQMWNDGTELWISRQVLREYLVQATHPNTFTPPLAVSEVVAQVDGIQRLFHVDDETQTVTDQLLYLLQTYPTRGKQVHDANIIATMLAYQIDTSLTMNVSDFNRFAGLIRLIGVAKNV